MTYPERLAYLERNKKIAYIRNIIKYIIAAIAIIAIAIFLFIRSNQWKEVKNSSTISWCESADNDNYSNIKNDLSSFVTYKTGDAPEKVVFFLNVGNKSAGTYTCTIYYLYDGSWYTKDFSGLQISYYNPELDGELLELCQEIN